MLSWATLAHIYIYSSARLQKTSFSPGPFLTSHLSFYLRTSGLPTAYMTKTIPIITDPNTPPFTPPRLPMFGSETPSTLTLEFDPYNLNDDKGSFTPAITATSTSISPSNPTIQHKPKRDWRFWCIILSLFVPTFLTALELVRSSLYPFRSVLRLMETGRATDCNRHRVTRYR